MKKTKQKQQKRPGAARRHAGGMPKGHKTRKTLEKAAAREAFRALVAADIEPMVKAQIANAKGMFYMVIRDKTTGKFLRVGKHAAEKLKPGEELIEIWEKDPSVQAFTDIMNRYLDKPKEQEQEVNHTGTIEVVWDDGSGKS